MTSQNLNPAGADARISRQMLGWLPGFGLLDRFALVLLGVVTLAMMAALTVPHAVYIRSYLWDTLGLLDGIHRMVLGQIPHRDFSTNIGLVAYGLPALFARAGADPLESIGYASCVLLALNFLVLAHLLTTRLRGMLGLLFGLWTVLALTARLNFGEDPQFVTIAMFYNRFCDVFLCSFMLFFIPPIGPRRLVAVLDTIFLAVITFVLFYTKITFGLCALAGGVLLALYRWRDAMRPIVAIALFLVAAATLELMFHFHLAFLKDLLMALQASRANVQVRAAIGYEVAVNFPEIVICIIVPGLVLIRNRMMTFPVFLLFLFVLLTSVLLLNESAQTRILTLPFVLLFITLDLLARALRETPEPTSAARFTLQSHLMYGAVLVVWFVYCFPLAINIATSFAKSMHRQEAEAGIGLLGEIRLDPRGETALAQLASSDGPLPPLEIFERGIDSTEMNAPDRVTETEYVASLKDGIAALKEGCGPSPRVLTADFANPFDALLGFPVGGGMIYIHPGLSVSEQNHIPPEQLFSDIDCVMVPKLPVQAGARNFFISAYGDYLKQNFEAAKDADYWTVLRRKAS